MIGAMPTLIQPSPASTQCAHSTTSGVSFSIGGSTGWNQAQGVNAGLTGGVSISNSTTVTCPSVLITNQSNPTTGISRWEYVAGAPSSPNLTSFVNQWVWEVPFSSYSKGQQSATVGSGGISNWRPCSDQGNSGCFINMVMRSEVPLPFGDTFALQKPTVASATPACVAPGSTFAIAGTGFYPSLVSSVLIGGAPLSPAQFTATSDIVIDAVAPRQSGRPCRSSCRRRRACPTPMSR